MSEMWSWLLTAVGVTGLYFAGKRRALGWAIGLGAQGLWLAYAVVTRQWGFLVSCACYGTVYARNFAQWRRGDSATEHQHMWQLNEDGRKPTRCAICRKPVLPWWTRWRTRIGTRTAIVQGTLLRWSDNIRKAIHR